MDHDDDGDVAFEPTYLQALLTAAGRNVATVIKISIELCAKSSFTLY